MICGLDSSLAFPFRQGDPDVGDLIDEPICVPENAMPEAGNERVEVSQRDPIDHVETGQMKGDAGAARKGFDEELGSKTVELDGFQDVRSQPPFRTRIPEWAQQRIVSCGPGVFTLRHFLTVSSA